MARESRGALSSAGAKGALLVSVTARAYREGKGNERIVRVKCELVTAVVVAHQVRFGELGQVQQQAQMAGGMLAEGGQERGGQEVGVVGGFEQVGEAVVELFGGMTTQGTVGASHEGRHLVGSGPRGGSAPPASAPP